MKYKIIEFKQEPTLKDNLLLDKWEEYIIYVVARTDWKLKLADLFDTTRWSPNEKDVPFGWRVVKRFLDKKEASNYLAKKRQNN